MEFPWQEYWHGLPFYSPGNILDPGIKPTYPELIGIFFTTEPPGKPILHILPCPRSILSSVCVLILFFPLTGPKLLKLRSPESNCCLSPFILLQDNEHKDDAAGIGVRGGDGVNSN